jgi:hypothetical protein
MAWDGVVVDGASVDFAVNHNEMINQIKSRLVGVLGATPSTFVLINAAGTGATGTDYIVTATAADIKMNGAQAVGTLHKVPHADHVHPTDTSLLSTATAAIPKRSIFLSCAGGWSSTTFGDSGFTTTETSTAATPYVFNFKGTKFDATASGTDPCHEFASPMPENWNAGTVTAVPYGIVGNTTPVDGSTIILGLRGAIVYGNSASPYGDLVGATPNSPLVFGSAATTGFVLYSTQQNRFFKLPATPAITLGGATPAGGAWVQWKMHRSGADTYTGSATVLGWMISYTTDTYSDE